MSLCSVHSGGNHTFLLLAIRTCTGGSTRLALSLHWRTASSTMVSTPTTCRRWSHTGEMTLTGGDKLTNSTSTPTSRPTLKVKLHWWQFGEKHIVLPLTFSHPLYFHPGIDIHYLHVKPKRVPEGATAVPLIMVHGWPGSFYEFYGLIPLLTDPSDPDDLVFEVVCPSIPGYGFSEAPHKKGDSGAGDFWK